MVDAARSRLTECIIVDMFQVLGWAATVLCGLEISMGVRTVVASWRGGRR